MFFLKKCLHLCCKGVIKSTPNVTETTIQISESTCRLYKKRWFVLLLFVLYAGNSLMQYIQYAIIADVLVKFYGVSYNDVNQTYMVYLLLYVFLFFPGIYVLEKCGLRKSVLLAMVGTTIGAWIKVISAVSDRFWVLFLGQCLVCGFQVLVQPIPPKLASTWFGPNELSTACSIGVIGNQLGEAIGLLFPPQVVNSNQSMEEMEIGFLNIAYGTAGVSTIILALLIFWFQDKPHCPPSNAQLKIVHLEKNGNIWKSLKILLTNPAYLLILAAYAANTSVYIVLLQLLNQIVLYYYPDKAEDAGLIGLLAIAVGALATFVTGIVLDKYRIYKTMTLASLITSIVITISFNFLAPYGIAVVYALVILLSCSLRITLLVMFEAASEVTYPEPSNISSGILVTVPQALAVLTTYVYSYLFHDVAAVYADLSWTVLLLLAVVLVSFTRYDLKRNNAQS